MNGNEVGARTLGYLRGEADLGKARQRFERLRKEVRASASVIGVSERQKHKMERFWKVAYLLQENSRMSLTEMSKKFNLPITSVFDTLKQVQKLYHFTIVLKESEKDMLARESPPCEFAYQFSIENCAKD